MKTKILTLSIILTGFVCNSFAQATAYATTTAVLVAPIAIINTVNMHFGTVASSATAGTVVLDFANGRTTTGGASLPVGGVAATTAQFVVTGEGASSFSIAIPTAPITLSGSVTGTLTVGSFLCDQGATTTLITGSRTLLISATLDVPANTAAGVYTNATANASALFVTVNYN
jgi:hypothetical protein